MKRALLGGFVSFLATILNAQNCSLLILDTMNPGYWPGEATPMAGGGFLLTYSTDYPNGDVGMIRYSSNGNALWEKHKMALNPAVLLWGNEARTTQDGGALICGGRVNQATTTENSYIIKVDSTGATQWARIYQRKAIADETSAGGYFLVASTDGGARVAGTDPYGVPVWVHALEGYYANSIKLANGDHLVTTVRDDSASVVRRMDQNGNTIWSTAIDHNMGSDRGHQAFERADGNLVVARTEGWPTNGTVLTLLEANGVWLSSTRLDDILLNRFFELPSGALFALGQEVNEPFVLGLSSTLVPQSRWNAAPDQFVHSPLSENDDTLRVLIHNGWPTDVSLLKAGPPYDLSCALSSGPTPTVTALTPIISTPAALFPDTLRNWQMALVEFDPNACDISVAASCGTPRPGFTVGHYFTVENQGGYGSGPLTITATLDPSFVIQSTAPLATSIVGNTVTWANSASLAGLGSTSVQVLVALPPDTALLGQEVTSTLNVVQDTLETSFTNNTFSFTRTITGSFDPNDKLVFPKDFYHFTNDSILDYTIRFQNTGTDTAFNIVVIDTLPPDVDVLTFQTGAASHPYTYSLTGEGLLKFTFANILLPDSNTNEPLSHGLVSFRIKPIQPVYMGQTITNVADIYFDFNPPVRTPPATVVVTNLTGIVPMPAPELRVFPVPVHDVLTVELPETFRPRNAIITAADGRTVWISGITGARERLNVPVQQLALGAYQITLLSMNGERLSARFVKE